MPLQDCIGGVRTVGHDGHTRKVEACQLHPFAHEVEIVNVDCTKQGEVSNRTGICVADEGGECSLPIPTGRVCSPHRRHSER